MTLPNIYDKKPLTISVGKLIPRKRKLDSDVCASNVSSFKIKLKLKLKVKFLTCMNLIVQTKIIQENISRFNYGARRVVLFGT